MLEVQGLRAKDDRGHETVRGVDLDVRAGEIYGLAGVAGNGQEELVESLTGLRRPTAGVVRLAGRDVTGAGPRTLQRAGMSFVPGDRHRFGMVLSFSIEDNLVLTQYDPGEIYPVGAEVHVQLIKEALHLLPKE